MQDNLTRQQLDYLQSYINSAAGFKLPSDRFSEQVLSEMFYCISRQEELDSSHRDRWGNWEACFSEAFLTGRSAQPWLDELIISSAQSCLTEKPGTKQNAKYPGGHGFAVCLTHDVDNINYYPCLDSYLHAWKRFYRCNDFSFEAVKLILLKSAKDVTKNNNQYLQLLDFNHFTDIEEKYGFRSTFYLFSPLLPHPHFYDSFYRFEDYVCYKKHKVSLVTLVKDLLSSGFDIGLHGSYNSAFETDVLEQEKTALENIIQHQVESIRQHWMHFDVKTTTQIHSQLGFLSDSTLGFNRFTGFRAGVSHPFKLWNSKTNAPAGHWEIPLVVMDGALFYANSLELDEKLAMKHCMMLMDRAEKVGGVFTINWHPDHLGKRRFKALYEEILAEAKRRKAWGCSALQLASRWKDYFTVVNDTQQ